MMSEIAGGYSSPRGRQLDATLCRENGSINSWSRQCRFGSIKTIVIQSPAPTGIAADADMQSAVGFPVMPRIFKSAATWVPGDRAQYQAATSESCRLKYLGCN
jgi:hypothetical protein